MEPKLAQSWWGAQRREERAEPPNPWAALADGQHVALPFGAEPTRAGSGYASPRRWTSR
jgi:hypothetical protein